MVKILENSRQENPYLRRGGGCIGTSLFGKAGLCLRKGGGRRGGGGKRSLHYRAEKKSGHQQRGGRGKETLLSLGGQSETV